MRDRNVRLDELTEPGRSFRERVYDLVCQIPRGRVITYGEVAAELGSPRAARVVGGALHTLPPGTDVPWHRVVNHRGGISIRRPEYAQLQRLRLLEEGVEFGPDDEIDLRRFGWGMDETAQTRAEAG